MPVTAKITAEQAKIVEDLIRRSVERVAAQRRDLDAEELRVIEMARDIGVTWQQLADWCGYRRRQGAQMRYRTLLAAGQERTAR